MLDGLVYSADSGLADSPLAIIASLASGDVERIEMARQFSLVLPGTRGVIISTVTVNSTPCYSVKFDGVDKEVAVPGRFLQRI